MTSAHPSVLQPGPHDRADLRSGKWDGHNVIAASFEDDRAAYKALTSLDELDSQQRVGVRDAVVVVRDEDGQVIVKERIESTFLRATVGGGLIGLLIGVLGGPLGVVVGGISGLVVGSVFDSSAIEDADEALAAISSSVRLGDTALLAVVDEGPTWRLSTPPCPISTAPSSAALWPMSRPEIAVAEIAERTAKREARKELISNLHEHDEAAECKPELEELKAKLNHGRQPKPTTPPRPPAARG